MIGRQRFRLARLQFVFLFLFSCTALTSFILLLDADETSRLFLFGTQTRSLSNISGVASTPPAPESKQPWLLIAIPTVERPGDMLIRSLHDIDVQISPEIQQQIAVMVVKNSEIHSEFENARLQYSGREHFIFVENRNHSFEAPPPGADLGDDRHPSWNVQQQSLDLIFLMDFAAQNVSPSYFMFMEDDFTLCPGGMSAIIHLIEKADRAYPDWIGLLFSEGMNGIILKREDLKGFASYLGEHYQRRPPDHLIVEWLAGETEQSASYRKSRPHLSFRYNLLQHRGVDSTLRAAKAFIADTCFLINDNSRMFDVVSFKLDQCIHDDIWPCLSPREDRLAQTWSPPLDLSTD